MMAKAITPEARPATKAAELFSNVGGRLEKLPTAARRLRVTLSVLGDILERMEYRRAKLAGEIAKNQDWLSEAEEFDVLLIDALERAQELEHELYAVSDDFIEAETELQR